MPNFDLEKQALQKYGVPVAGVDEAGRGPWAGPVVAAAVILDPDRIPVGLDDSKKLKTNQREHLFDMLMTSAHVGVGIADVARIDRDNILNATLWAMTQAVAQLPMEARSVLVDGNRSPHLQCPTQLVIKGDSQSLSIAAASIIAKVTRDKMMYDLALQFPQYGWETNKGYGTKHHVEALNLHGATCHHRRSFKPVQKVLESC